MKYVQAKEAREFFQVTAPTLMNWVKQGRIKCRKLSQRKFLYDIDSYKDNTVIKEDTRTNVLYARVSNTKQYEDLQNQIETIKNYCLNKGIIIDEVYKDIASGMNEQRKEFNILLDEVIKGNIKTVYITFKDRLTRFGFEYFKELFRKFDVNIVVLDSNEESSKTFQEELTEDLISIIPHYSMKLYSGRRNKLKKINEILAEKTD